MQVPQWEYDLAYIGADIDTRRQQFNDWGRRGWIFCGVDALGWCVFRRAVDELVTAARRER